MRQYTNFLSQNIAVPYTTMHHSEEKCAYIISVLNGALWVMQKGVLWELDELYIYLYIFHFLQALSFNGSELQSRKQGFANISSSYGLVPARNKP